MKPRDLVFIITGKLTECLGPVEESRQKTASANIQHSIYYFIYLRSILMLSPNSLLFLSYGCFRSGFAIVSYILIGYFTILLLAG
jgi:hypothetical protein